MKRYCVLSLLFTGLLLICGAATLKADPITIAGSFNTTFELQCLDAACAKARSLVTGPGTITLGGKSFTATVSIDQMVDGAQLVGTTIFTLPNGDKLVTANVGPLGAPVNGTAPFSGTFTIQSGTGVFAGLTGALPYTGSATFLSATGGTGQFSFSGTAAPVPEPATLLLLGTGLAGVVTGLRRKRRHGSPS